VVPDGGSQAQRVDVPPGVVEMMPGLRVDATDRSDHLRAEHDIARVDDLE
jgi:hypothetical protein